MIPKASVTQWREKAPWMTDEQVEQDLILSRVLVDLFSDPLLNKELAFRGRCNILKLEQETAASVFEFKNAAIQVYERFVKKLPGESWKKVDNLLSLL